MITEKKALRLRLLQWLLLVTVVGTAVGLAWSMTQDIDILIQYGLVAGLVVGLFCLYLTQRKVDGWMTAAVLQSNYAANEEFNSLFESSPVAYITIDSNGKIVDFNPAAINLLGATADTMYNQVFFSLVHPDFDISLVQGKVRSGMTVNDEEVLLRSFEGDDIWVSLSIHARNPEQRIIAMVDITEQKAVDTAKSEFVALATHQLRTPIAAIRWNVELLRKNMNDSITPDQDRYMVKVERNVHRMVHLINDFLSVSKLEMGTFASSQEAVNLTSFFDSILDEFNEKITQKTLKVDRRDNPPQVQIMTDSRLFHIIVSNLVSNAVKYLNPNGILTLTYDLAGTNLRIVVGDNGIGIPEEEIDRLFTKFFRATNAQTHQTQGTGLGLYVVKQSVEQLGGSIEVTSRENEGAEFVINLPVTVLSSGS
jgi:PAS domain S-box-containing protein